MMIVALLMRPWIMMMRELNAEPKVLADDVMIIAKGTRMIKRLARSLNGTHTDLHDMGAKNSTCEVLQLCNHADS